MATITTLNYYGPQASGFSISVADMEVDIGDGHFDGVNYTGTGFSVNAPSAAAEEWAVWAMADGTLVQQYAGAVPSGSTKQKIVWTTVASGDVDLESHGFTRYLPIARP